MSVFVEAEPYPWPFDGDLRPANTALVVIDMQTDFCGPGGYVDAMGYDLSLTRAPIGPIRELLSAMRRRGFHVIHTREGASARPLGPAREQALALAPHRGGHRRSRALWPYPRPRGTRVGDHPRAGPGGR